MYPPTYNTVQTKEGQKQQMMCKSTIMEIDMPRHQFMVGNHFMRKYYTIFDRDFNRVGLAEANTEDKIKQMSLQQKK